MLESADEMPLTTEPAAVPRDGRIPATEELLGVASVVLAAAELPEALKAKEDAVLEVTTPPGPKVIALPEEDGADAAVSVVPLVDAVVG